MPIDYTNRIPVISRFLPENGIKLWGKYKRHPDQRQEALFFSLLKECLDSGEISVDRIKSEMASGHMRQDAIEMTKRAQPLDSVLNSVKLAA